MKSLIYWIVTLLLAAAAAAFASFNQHPATIDLWPLNLTFSLPLYLIVLLALACGFLLGGLVAFLLGSGERARRREALYRSEMLERENARLRDKPESNRPEQAKGKSLLAPR